jgi:hypothetical protein
MLPEKPYNHFGSVYKNVMKTILPKTAVLNMHYHLSLKQELTTLTIFSFCISTTSYC